MELRQSSLCVGRFRRNDSHLGCRENGHVLIVVLLNVIFQRFHRRQSSELVEQSAQHSRNQQCYQQWPHRLQSSYSEDEQFRSHWNGLGFHPFLLILKQYSEQPVVGLLDRMPADLPVALQSAQRES